MWPQSGVLPVQKDIHQITSIAKRNHFLVQRTVVAVLILFAMMADVWIKDEILQCVNPELHQSMHNQGK